MMTMKSTTAADNMPSRTARASTADPGVSIPRGHVGPYFMSGLGKMIWWTGRVAIGLRYEPLREDKLQDRCITKS
jgi:hypothetical protein